MNGLQQVHVTIAWDSYAIHLPVEHHHDCQANDLYQNYTWAAHRAISDAYSCTSRFNHDDTILLPWLRSEKPSAVRINIGHTYCTLSSGVTHSQVSIMQNYMCSRQSQNMRVSGISKPRHQEVGTTCGTPRSTEGLDSSMRCLKDQWHWLKSRGQKRTCSLGWVRMHCNFISIRNMGLTCHYLRWWRIG